jgi:hypothetical protein
MCVTNGEQSMTTRMRTVANEDQARTLMVSRNRARCDRREDISVMVEGPGDGEWTVLNLRDAIAAGFLYRWEA